MASFTVHTPASKAGEPPSPDKIMFLRDGFSWWAFLFGPLWLAWNRAWLGAALSFVAMLAIGFGGAKLGVGDTALSLINLAIGLAFGFEGARLVAWTLARRGYREVAVVNGDTQEEAEEAYFRSGRPEPAPAPYPAGPWDAIAARAQEGRSA